MDGTGTDALLLPELPVAEVSAVTVAGEEDATTTPTRSTIPGSCCAPWAPTGSVFATEAAWPKGRNNVEITYSHGYADADFPRSVRMVAVRLAARFYQQPSGVVLKASASARCAMRVTPAASQPPIRSSSASTPTSASPRASSWRGGEARKRRKAPDLAVLVPSCAGFTGSRRFFAR